MSDSYEERNSPEVKCRKVNGLTIEEFEDYCDNYNKFIKMSDSYEVVEYAGDICRNANGLTLDQFEMNCLSYDGEY